jgi:hypothetical protein
VRFAEDQRSVEDFAAQRADEALADRVHPGAWTAVTRILVPVA